MLCAKFGKSKPPVSTSGTLLKFSKSPVQIYIEAACGHGITADPIALSSSFKAQWKRMNAEKPHFGHCWKSWWSEFLVSTFENSHCAGSTPEKLHMIADELIFRFATGEFWKVSPDGEEMLNWLKTEKSFPLGVISNFDPRLHEILASKMLSSYFEFVITSHECQISKPDPRIFELGLNSGKKLNPQLRPQNLLHIGNSYELDCAGATAAGWNACLIQDDEEVPSSSTKTCPVYPNLRSLINK